MKPVIIIAAILAIILGFVYRECQHKKLVMEIFKTEEADAINIVREFCQKNRVTGEYKIMSCPYTWAGKKASELPKSDLAKAAKELKSVGGEIIFRNYITNRMIVFHRIDTLAAVPYKSKLNIYQDFDEDENKLKEYKWHPK